MAQRRMFSKHIIDSDAFLDMPLSTQSLYFHLSMRADDDGFINNPKKIMRMIGASEDEMKVLASKRFLLGFENGVIVIKHWRIHNQIRKDRHVDTIYKEEFSRLEIKENGAYSEKNDQKQEKIDWQPDGNQMEPQYSIGKDSIDKLSTEQQAELSLEQEYIKQLEEEVTQYEKPKKPKKAPAKAGNDNWFSLTNKSIKQNWLNKDQVVILGLFIDNTTMEVTHKNLYGICKKIKEIDSALLYLYRDNYNSGARHYVPFTLLHYLKYRNWYITADVFKYFDTWIKEWDKDTRAGYANNGEYYIYNLDNKSTKNKIDTVGWKEWNNLMLEANRINK